MSPFNTKTRNKYHSKKTVYDGIEFDSKREAGRYAELKQLEKSGEISELELQKKFSLVPPQYAPSNEYYKSGKNKGQLKRGKLIERGIDYIADFCYKDKHGNLIVEDSKGYRDPSSAGYAKFVIKRKLMLYCYGIRVNEV